jgi:hypothetical protein
MRNFAYFEDRKKGFDDTWKIVKEEKNYLVAKLKLDL